MGQARILGALSDIPAAQWDALHDGSHPFASSRLEAAAHLRRQLRTLTRDA